MDRKHRLYLRLVATLYCVAAPLCAAMAAPPANSIILEGSVSAVRWMSAGTQFVMAVVDGMGGSSNWVVRGPAAAQLERLGWSASTLKPGDHIDLVVLPDAEDLRSANLVRAILANGTEFESSSDSHLIPTIPVEAAAHIETAVPNDPAAGYYGNTVTCRGPTWECHAWISADHRLLMFSRDQQLDGSYALRGLEGTWWLQELQHAYFMCFAFIGRSAPPICYSRLNYEHVGDLWQSVLPTGLKETKQIIAGRH